MTKEEIIAKIKALEEEFDSYSYEGDDDIYDIDDADILASAQEEIEASLRYYKRKLKQLK